MREGHFHAAEEVLKFIVPFFNSVRFYPSESVTFEGVELIFNSRNVHDLRLSLEEYVFVGSSATIAQRRKFANACGLAWKDWKHQVIYWMSLTSSCAHTPAYISSSKCTVSFGKSSNRSNFKKARSQTPTPYVYADCPHDCGRPLARFAPASNKQAEYLYSRCQVLLSVNRSPFKEGTSTHTLIKCLTAYVLYSRGTKAHLFGPDGLSSRDVGLLRNIIAGSNTAHGLLFSETYAHYIAPLTDSINQAHHLVEHHLCASEMITKLNNLDQSQGLSDPDTFLESISRHVPESLQQLVFDTVRGSVRKHIRFRNLKHVEDIADLSFDMFREILTEPPKYALQQLLHALKEVDARKPPHTVVPWTAALKRVEAKPTEADADSVNRAAAEQVLHIMVKEAVRNFPDQELSNRFLGRLQYFASTAGVTWSHLIHLIQCSGY